MSDLVTCPTCRSEFAVGDALRARMEADARSLMQGELQAKFAEATELAAAAGAREAELLTRERELTARSREAELERERVLSLERAKIHADAQRYADERATLAVEKERETVRREETRLASELAKSLAELEAAKRRSDEVAEQEATLLRRQRDLEERQRAAAAEMAQTLSAERTKIVKAAEGAARTRFDAYAKAEAERLTREASSEVERLRAEAAREKQTLSSELDDARRKVNDAAALELELLRKERELSDRERGASLEIERKLAVERIRIQEEAERRATEAAELRAHVSAEQVRRDANVRIELIERDLTEARKLAEDAAAKEVSVLRQVQELEVARRRMDLDVERRLVDERQRIQTETDCHAAERLRLAAEETRLREKEHEVLRAQLERTVETLQQKLTQGSQQTQGEAQELVLRDILMATFPEDHIEDVAKGLRGADLMHRIRGAAAEECGAIVWESKRTQTWSDGWLEKVRDDLREAGGAVAVIVSRALPAGITTFDLREGVWICSWSHAQALAGVLRAGILDVHRARRANEGRDMKMVHLYDYLTGDDFRNRVRGVIEAMVSLQEEVATERRAFTRLWKRREALIARALQQLGEVYGSLEGIAGAKLSDIDALSLSGTRPVLLEAADGSAVDDDCAADELGDASRDVGVTLDLERALYDLVPVDGRPIGNMLLRSELELHDDVSEAQFHAARESLVAKGLLRKGRGRGGAVMRTSSRSEAGVRGPERV